jgi:putative tryptophan/tyrosine transport system substrate-binding protein
MAIHIRRRELVFTLGGAAAAWPLAARAQQPVMPVVGFLSSRSPGESATSEAAFRAGLKESGYAEGENAHIAFRWAEGQYRRLAVLAADLVAIRVAVIAAVGGGPSIMAAKAATATIPIVFTFGGDPVKAGFVASFDRPGGNITGVSWFSAALAGKRLELLLQLVSDASIVALLLNPNSEEAAPQSPDFEQAARHLGRQFHILNAGSEAEIDAAFRALVERRVGALVVSSDPFFLTRRQQLVALAARHAIPTIYSTQGYVADGGLMSYSNSLTSAYRRAGGYVGRILKGAKPADLPIWQATEFELVINLKTAKALGLDIPPTLLTRADEVIE